MVMNAPRGPSHMRRERQETQRQRSARPEQSPGKRDKKDRKKEKEKDTAKTTLTDFRIVGIEMKELGWSWGLVGEEAMNQVEEVGKEDETKVVDTEPKSEDAAPADASTDLPQPATAEEADVKQETTDAGPEVETKVEAEAASDSAEVKDEPYPESAAPKEEVPASTDTEDGDGKGKTGGKRKAQSPETGKSLTLLPCPSVT